DWTTTAAIDASLANLNGQTGNKFITFCIEVTQNVNIGGTYTFTQQGAGTLPTSGAMGANKANDLAQFWKANAGTIAGLTTADDALAAAIQLAIWEIVYEKDYSGAYTAGYYNVNSEQAAGQGFKVTSGDSSIRTT